MATGPWGCEKSCPKLSPRSSEGTPERLFNCGGFCGNTGRVYTTLTAQAQAPGVGTAVGMDVLREQNSPVCQEPAGPQSPFLGARAVQGRAMPWETFRPQHKLSENTLFPPFFLTFYPKQRL